MEQRTLRTEFALEGVGIHSGAPARVVVRPAPPNYGRVFVREGIEIPALAANVVDTARCTTLGAGGERVRTVEHLLSALYALDVDNARIEIDGPEVPAMDGSALPFMEAIERAGIVGQDCEARVLTVCEKIPVDMGTAMLRAEPAGELAIDVTTRFEDWREGEAQVLATVGAHQAEGYRTRIAPARTFAFRQEVEVLIAAGLAQGGSLDNALIITPPSEFSTPLRVPQEWCAHKALDLIGDLSLVGARLRARITAQGAGHRANVLLARELVASAELDEEDRIAARGHSA
jgi:UDP-3-O-[3-hydroxymyristoyl] N-acetylglucosamine deacetylase